VGVQTQGMVGDDKAFGKRDSLLALFNFSIVELFNPAAIDAHHVVVVLSLIEFVDSFAAFKMVAAQNTRLFKLGQYPVNSGQANLGVFGQQMAKHMFRCHVALNSFLALPGFIFGAYLGLLYLQWRLSPKPC
jgi:hypothetical protein